MKERERQVEGKIQRLEREGEIREREREREGEKERELGIERGKESKSS